MIEPGHIVAYGRSASVALASVITSAQQDDPLAPVTVIVPSNFVGLSARRLLGSDTLHVGERRGIANVSFVTPFQLVERVAADLLLDTRPITNPVLGAAVRQALADDPDVYAPVARHEATEAALAGLFAELSNVDEAGLEAILDEGSTAASLAVKFHRAIASRLTGFHTEHDLATAAAHRDDLAARLRPFGHVVWYLPAPLTPALGHFVSRVLSDAVGRSVVVGVSGVNEADEAMWRTCESAGVIRPTTPERGETAPPTADHIVSVTDAPEEVREVCSRIIGLVESGVPLDRIAVFYPAPDPYVRIIEQQFEAANIPANGPDPRRLADSVAGRTLLAALDLPDARWRRDRVIALISGGPLRFGDDRVRPAAWDEVTRDAGVVGNLSDWRTKLERHRSTTQKQLDELGDPTDDQEAWRARKLNDRLVDVAKLREFVDRLVDLIGKVTTARSWPEKCAAAAALVRDLLGPEHQHASWPVSEQDAFARVEDALVRLAALDDIEPAPANDVFVRALRTELDVARGRHGRFGHGVMYGPIGSAIGHDVDAVFVLGAAEGVLPVPRRDDAILPERVRINSLDQLESKSARLHHQHRAFLAALAAAPPGERNILFPRGDLRSSRRALPSRWLLDTASALAGRPVHATNFGALGADVVETIASFATGVRTARSATSIDERDVVVLGAAVDSGIDAVDHPLASLVGAGLAMQVGRASDRFTAFDGNLAGHDTTGERRAVSPSRLQTWAACGFRYFLQHVLEVSDRDDPERTDDISASDRGSLIHSTLERFIAEAIRSGTPRPETEWSEEDRNRLHVIAGEVAEEYELTGRTGRAVSWRVRRDELRDVLDTFITVDNNFRRSHRATPAGVELSFGVRNGDPVAFDLPNGSTVLMRGLVDRVDTTDDGRVIVSDYKSGKGKKFAKLDEDPFGAGTTLQLGMYAEGARRDLGLDHADAAYWLVEVDGHERRGYHWTADLRARFDEVLTAITDGIGAGVFAATPGDWDTFRQTNDECIYCHFDAVCVRNRGEHAEAKADAPEVQVRLRLQPPSDGGER